MGPKLRVSSGPSLSQLKVVETNYDVSAPFSIDSELFEGHIAVRIRDFTGDIGPHKQVRRSTESDYFDKFPNLTWSMGIQGRFKEDIDADDVMFGNVFEKPIRDHLPYGTSAALKFVNFVDPALEQDIYSDQPWALSPLIATMNHMKAQTLSDTSKHPEWSAAQPQDDIEPLYSPETISKVSQLQGDANARRAYFSKKEHRKEVTFKPEHWLDLDFCNGYLDFNTFSLKIPGGLQFSLMRYWDGQPVTYVCKTRDSTKEFFFIVFDIIDEEIIQQKKDAGVLATDAKEDAQQSAEPQSQTDDLGVD